MHREARFGAVYTGSGGAVAGVFVSYASEDVALACEVRRWLKDDRHEVFLAEDLRDGIAAGE